MTAEIINEMTGLPLTPGYLARVIASGEDFPAITMLHNRDKYGHATRRVGGSLWERIAEGKRDRDLWIWGGVQRAAHIAGVERLNRLYPR